LAIYKGLLPSIPTYKSLPFGNFVTTNKTEIVPPQEFQWRIFAEHAQNFWKILIALCYQPHRYAHFTDDA
jgi:hypothetical protein